MKKLLIVLIVSIFLNFSQQLECSEYSFSSSCGLFNTGYKFQCFMSSTCQEVKVESGCQMKDGSCIKEGDAQNVECHLYDHPIGFGKNLKVCKKIIVDPGCEVLSPTECQANTNNKDKKKCEYTENNSHCKIYDKTCEDYDTKVCGNLALGKESGTNQCYLPVHGNCQEVLIDEYCYVDDNRQCTKRKEFNETLYKCLDGTEDEKQTCKRIAKKCEEQNTLDKCREFGANCYKANIQGRTTSCNEVKVISPKCKIDTNGDCVADQADTDYENCDFIQENGEYKCGPINKACNEVAKNDKCNKIELADGHICTKVKDYTTTPCKDVLIDPECQIDANGECKIITPSKKNKCQYVNGFYKCQFYEIDSECKIEDNTCKNNGNPPPEGQKCDFVDLSRTKCKLRDIRCDEISQDQCDGENVINRQSGRKCSWNGDYCKEYKIDNVCTVTSADQCGEKADATLQEKYKCLFTNSSLLECIQKQDTCESYYTDCSSHKVENKIQCIDNYPNCKKIEIDENCEVNNRGSCVTKNGKTIDSTKKCDFWNEEKTICKIMDKPCGEFDNKNDCHTVDNCAYITPYGYSSSYCYLTETKDNNVCKLDDKRECIPAKENSIANYETCNFIYDSENKKAICQKRILGCNEIKDQNICNSVKIDEQQCIYSDRSCLELINDDYCYYNTNEGKCTFRSGNQPSNYYCTTSTYSGKYYCERAEKKCSSITKTEECNSFTPVDRQCFYVQGYGDNYRCKNIEVDSQCKINEEGKCTGNGCAYDDDDEKNHCAYKNNDSAILKVKRLLLLALFFIF